MVVVITSGVWTWQAQVRSNVPQVIRGPIPTSMGPAVGVVLAGPLNQT